MLPKLEDVPRSLRSKMTAINQQVDIFLAEVKEFQTNCEHNWQKLTEYREYDSHFSRSYGRNQSHDNKQRFRCSKCNLLSF